MGAASAVMRVFYRTVKKELFTFTFGHDLQVVTVTMMSPIQVAELSFLRRGGKESTEEVWESG